MRLSSPVHVRARTGTTPTRLPPNRSPVIRPGNFWHSPNRVDDSPHEEAVVGEQSFVASSHGFGFTQEVGLSQMEKTARTVDVSSINDNDDANFPTAESQSEDNGNEDENDDTYQILTERELFRDYTSYGRELTQMAAKDKDTQKIFCEGMRDLLARVSVSAAKNHPAGPATTVGGTLFLPETETNKKARRLKPCYSPPGKMKTKK